MLTLSRGPTTYYGAHAWCMDLGCGIAGERGAINGNDTDNDNDNYADKVLFIHRRI